MAKKPQTDERVIKRYANRKLYDTVTRQFTSLDELARLLDGGKVFTVLDHDTGANRTDEILAQVLGRRAKQGGSTSNLLSELLNAPTGILGALTNAAPVTAPAAEVEDEEDGENIDETVVRQEAEIAELRSQVSQLTEAVSLLLQDKISSESAEPKSKKSKKK